MKHFKIQKFLHTSCRQGLLITYIIFREKLKKGDREKKVLHSQTYFNKWCINVGGMFSSRNRREDDSIPVIWYNKLTAILVSIFLCTSNWERFTIFYHTINFLGGGGKKEAGKLLLNTISAMHVNSNDKYSSLRSSQWYIKLLFPYSMVFAQHFMLRDNKH